MPASDAPADTPRVCAERFGAALRSGSARGIAPMLPQKGKVRLRLSRLGAEQGAYSAGQVQAVFQDFFKNGRVETFELLGPVPADERYALVRARAQLVDRHGMPSTVDLLLSLELESGHWVLRDIRESQR